MHAAGNLVGLFLSPLLLAKFGWRGLFYVFGLLGLPLLAVWLAIVPKPSPQAAPLAGFTKASTEHPSPIIRWVLPSSIPTVPAAGGEARVAATVHGWSAIVQRRLTPVEYRGSHISPGHEVVAEVLLLVSPALDCGISLPDLQPCQVRNLTYPAQGSKPAGQSVA